MLHGLLPASLWGLGNALLSEEIRTMGIKIRNVTEEQAGESLK